MAAVITSIPDDSAYFILDSVCDGLDQIAAILAGRSGTSALHIISHGADGALLLGGSLLTSGNLAQHATSLAAIASGLTAGADILLYGCDVAAGDAGSHFLRALAQATGADIAASNDATGLGGNWKLEAATGSIEATALAVNSYTSALGAVVGTPGDDILDGTTGLAALDGGAGEDAVDFRSANAPVSVDFVNGYAVLSETNISLINIESAYGSEFVDTISLFAAGGKAFAGGGDDILYGAAAGNSTLEGGAGNDTLYAQGPTNKLYGNDGDDIVFGFEGRDLLDGGTGDDIIDGGGDEDTVTYASATSGVVIDMAFGTATGGGGNDRLANIERVTGSDFDDLITVATQTAYADGAGGDDILTAARTGSMIFGGSGNDMLISGVGTDNMFGGADIDTASYRLATSAVTVNLATGFASGAMGFDALYEIESAIGSQFADTITLNAAGGSAFGEGGNDILVAGDNDNDLYGGSGNDTLTGGAGINILDGGFGQDGMTGGAGDDTYFVDSALDTVTEAADGGDDTVISSATLTLAVNIENLRLRGSTAINGTGNALDNTLIGNGAANVLTGLDGDDILNGGGGKDTMAGGAGDDVYYVDRTTDIVTEALDAGIDTVRSTVTLILATNAENLVLAGTAAISGTGNGLANTLTGNSGVNTLRGLAGQDILIGGGGNDILIGGADDDTYYVDGAGDVVTELDGAGIDTVVGGVTLTLAANVENLQLVGSLAAKGTGNALANALSGNGAANTLTGLDGDDILNGGAGSDTMVGGAGDDTYYVDVTGDVVTEAADSGIDVVNSTVALTLTANVENLSLIGGAAIAGTGNALANVLKGNGAANTLSGLVGNDTLIGGAGKDTLIGGTGADRFVFASGEFGGATATAADVISDFNAREGDLVDLRAVDANTLTLGANEAFAFIGGAAFGRVAGQLRVVQNATNTLIQGDTNGDGIADFMIALTGLRTLDAASFVL